MCCFRGQVQRSPTAKRKNKNSLEGFKLETWHKRERFTYSSMHLAYIENTTGTVLIEAILDFQVAPE